MNISVETLSATKKVLSISVDESELVSAKKASSSSSRKRKDSGFRNGKVPASIAEKHLDPQMLQAEVIDAQ